jgi:putative ABC transport system permease protein
MAQRWHDRWLLIRLAAQNLGRRPLRVILLGLAVMLGVGIAFASFVAGWGLRDGIATSFSRMGADLVVVPRPTLVNITASLLTVQRLLPPTWRKGLPPFQGSPASRRSGSFRLRSRAASST